MSYSFDDMAGLDQLISGIDDYGTFSDIPQDYFDPSWWDMSTFSSPTNYAPVEDRSWASPQQDSSSGWGGMLGGVWDGIGGLKGAAPLITGALGAYGSWQAGRQAEKNAKAERAALSQKMRMEEGQFGDEFAKMHALAQILQDRQGINLDPSLAYAQALRRKFGGSPDEANDFAGIDIGGPMKVGASSEDRQAAINEATAVNMRKGGLGLLRGGTGGQADKINAMLSDGEYVFDADVVAALGDGNTEAGARKLDQMRERIRGHKRGGSVKSIPPSAKDPMKYMKG